ncbi:MAG TPA: biopolymer transporter ExbD [Kofleriaceae bacterium]
MDYSAQRVRSKTRAAVRRREEVVEQEEMEGGEINLIPYLDIVTNLMLFLLASVTAGLVLVQIDTTLPDKAPPSQGPPKPQTNPDEQPLTLVLSVKRDEALLFSLNGLEGNINAPKATFRRTGRIGEACDGDYMCEKAACNKEARVCIESKEELHPVFDYRAINNALIEIAERRYNNKVRKLPTYSIILQADKSIPYSTIASLMTAMRCKLPALGVESVACALPSDAEKIKTGADPFNKDDNRYDTDRAPYDAKTMALFHDIQFSEGWE